MIVAAQHPTHDADQGAPVLAELGPQGVAVLLAIGLVVLTCKSKTVRQAEVRAIRAAFRYAWRVLVAVVRALVARVTGRRGITPSKEERRILARLAPGHWRDHAEHRHLDDTLTSRPKLTAAGIVVAVRCTGKMTPSRLAEREENVRALLGLRTALRVEITPGKRGGWAELTIRTRSAVDTADMNWQPGCKGIGLDAHTGKPVHLPRARFLLAGSSGAGKSVALRPFLAELAADDRAAVVLVDAKRVEGALWKTRARIARDAAEIEQVAVELQAEMMDRLTELETSGRASWTPTPARPTVVVVVDEGAEVKTIAPDATPAFESIARMGRAAEIHLVWCTQKPTMSGPSAGIPPQIAGQMDVRAALRLSSPTECRTVLGEDATAEKWDAHKLPKPGVLLLRGTGRGPAPVKVWFMDDATVRNLPPAPIWRRHVDRDHDDQAPPLLTKTPTAPRVDATARVLRLVEDNGPARQKDIAEQAGLPKGTVSKAVTRLLDAGQLARLDDGRVAIP
ncbi:MarR family transcriptional regulator [Streptomyces sp. NPDC001276]|uniref:MarR family transcriptional regulator n=1 Tax=Streptomyces sp. NPDC001276 TaxID=3364555 RepID=UPI00369361BE